jgi:hypothetical protein
MLCVVRLNVIMLSVVRLNVVMLSVVRLNVVILSVVAPLFPPVKTKCDMDLHRKSVSQGKLLICFLLKDLFTLSLSYLLLLVS